MARLWWDGFEYNSLNVLTFLYTYASGGGVQISDTEYTGERSLLFGSAYWLYLTLTSAKSTLIKKIHYRPGTVAETGAIMGFYKGTTCIGWLRQVNRNLEYYSGTGTGSLLGTAVNALSAVGTDWNLIEVKIIVADSGTLQVKVNEGLVINYSGDTKPGADEDIDRIYLGQCGGANCINNMIIDDFIVDDADWIGNRRVCKIQITGVGATSAVWDASTGSPYACIDEIPYSDTDYIYTNTIDECDTYACSDLPAEATRAKGLMVIARAAEEGTATPQNIQIACLTEETLYFGDSYAPPSGSAGFCKKLWVTNPETSADWTVSELNAVELGVKAVE